MSEDRIGGPETDWLQAKHVIGHPGLSVDGYNTPCHNASAQTSEIVRADRPGCRNTGSERPQLAAVCRTTQPPDTKIHTELLRMNPIWIILGLLRKAFNKPVAKQFRKGGI